MSRQRKSPTSQSSRSRRTPERSRKETAAYGQKGARKKNTWFIFAGVLAVALLATGIFIIWTRDQEMSEAELDQLIQTIETSFLKFGEDIKPKLARIPSAHMRSQLALPFEVVAINKENQYRNAKRKIPETAPGRGQLENMNFFLYDELPKSQARVVAGFVPTTRTVYVTKEMKSPNLLDMLIFFHETFHVTQDTAIRSRIASKEALETYFAFYTVQKGEKERIILNHETTAYAYELEIFRIIADGALERHTAPHERETALSAILGMRRNQSPTLSLLVRLAELYFIDHISPNMFNRLFIRTIARSYAHNRLFTGSAPGNLKEITLDDI